MSAVVRFARSFSKNDSMDFFFLFYIIMSDEQFRTASLPCIRLIGRGKGKEKRKIKTILEGVLDGKGMCAASFILVFGFRGLEAGGKRKNCNHFLLSPSPFAVQDMCKEENADSLSVLNNEKCAILDFITEKENNSSRRHLSETSGTDSPSSFMTPLLIPWIEFPHFEPEFSRR